MIRIVLTSRAEAELDEATGFYAAASARVAEEFLAEVAAALQRIAGAPLWWPRHDRRHRYFVLKRHAYVIYYRIESRRQIVVIAVAHASRKPNYWKRH